MRLVLMRHSKSWTERRVSRRKASLTAAQRIKTYFNHKLDPSLWSKLPQENVLDTFDALPVKDYYRLRRVCKHWHNRVSELRVRKPFFLLTRMSRESSPWGTLTLHAASGQWMWPVSHWMWQSLYNWPYYSLEIGHLLESFEVEGVLFHGQYMSESADYRTQLRRGATNVLFDVHRIQDYCKQYNPFAILERRIPHVDTAPGSVLGMMVDDASRAYTLILGSCVADTLLLDSRTNKWESKPSRLVRHRPPSASAAPKSCVQLRGKMYLWMDSDEIHVYCSSSNEWGALVVPPRDASNEDEFRGLGHWSGVLYAVSKNGQGRLSVWKLNMVDKHWSEYARIPGSLFAHLIQPGAVLPIVASHCNGYLLIHVFAQPDALPQPKTAMHLDDLLKQQKPMKLGRRFVLFNIANKRWEMVDMPYSKMWQGYQQFFRD